MNLYHSQNCQKRFGFPIVAAEVEEELCFVFNLFADIKINSKGMWTMVLKRLLIYAVLICVCSNHCLCLHSE